MITVQLDQKQGKAEGETDNTDWKNFIIMLVHFLSRL